MTMLTMTFSVAMQSEAGCWDLDKASKGKLGGGGGGGGLGGESVKGGRGARKRVGREKTTQLFYDSLRVKLVPHRHSLNKRVWLNI